jgi:hypothetical protein
MLSTLSTLSMLSIAQNVLEPFAQQHNVGNCYEFYTALHVLRVMGLSDADHMLLKPLVDKIVAMNSRSAEKFIAIYEQLHSKPVGVGATVGGVRVVNMRNVTQDDGDGGTGDLVLVLADGTEKSISVCEGKKKKDGSIEKCLSNPTCRRFGCDDSDVQQFKQIEAAAVIAYKAEMLEKYGADEAAWPSRKSTKAACDATSSVATATCAKFMGLSDVRKTEIMKDLLRVSVEAGSKPADPLCVVNDKCTTHLLYEIRGVAAGCVWTPRLVVENYWLNMYLGDVYIGRTQVKFNNGVYHKGKTSSLTNSWNATAVMNKVFDLVPLALG